MKMTKIKPNPNNPRKIDSAALQKLKDSVEQFPKMMKLRPIVIDQDGMILGGNMRYLALKEMGWKEIPDEWVKIADELTPDEKRRFIVADNVSGGDWDWEILGAEWDPIELENWGLEIPDGSNDFDYNTKVENPIYEAKSEKPLENDLYDLGKYNQLISEIDSSDLSEKEKEFLKLAATRHIKFNYRTIAEYYAHCNSEVQNLIENSALVIIDYNKAIELGFVKLFRDIEIMAENDD